MLLIYFRQVSFEDIRWTGIQDKGPVMAFCVRTFGTSGDKRLVSWIELNSAHLLWTAQWRTCNRKLDMCKSVDSVLCVCVCECQSSACNSDVLYFPAHKTHFFPEKCDLNSTCILCAGVSIISKLINTRTSIIQHHEIVKFASRSWDLESLLVNSILSYPGIYPNQSRPLGVANGATAPGPALEGAPRFRPKVVLISL
jgi:hypothetical protein